MKRLVLVCSLVASGCIVNHAELDSHQAALDRELAMAMEKADNLNELRKDADALEQQVLAGVQEFTELADEWKAVQAMPGAVITPRPPLLLPPESLFEGSGGAVKRRRLADSDARVRQLEKVIAEVVQLELRNQRARRMLTTIDKARAARAP